MLFDTHAHYDDDAFDQDRDLLLETLPERGVSLLVNPGCDVESSRKAVSYAKAYPHVYAAVGIHPENCGDFTAGDIEVLRQLAQQPKVVAIGEIGLDYYWDTEHKALQKEMFERQLSLAIERKLPVIVHDREAHGDCLEIVMNYPEARGVFHCFSGSAEMAKELIRRGWYLGFDGPVTYKSNKKAAEVLAVTPLERILVETDSPYMAPEPCRGKRNDSSLLVYVLEKIAALKGVSAEEMTRITQENGCRLFGIEA